MSTVGWINDGVFKRRGSLSPDGSASRIAATPSKLLQNRGVSTETEKGLKKRRGKKSWQIILVIKSDERIIYLYRTTRGKNCYLQNEIFENEVVVVVCSCELNVFDNQLVHHDVIGDYSFLRILRIGDLLPGSLRELWIMSHGLTCKEW